MRNRILLSILVLAACHKAPAPLPPGQVMNLQVFDQQGNPLGSAGVPADGYTYAVVVDTLVDISVLDTSMAVTFTTDNGMFAAGGMSYVTKFDQTGKAYAYIRNKLPVAAHVQVSVGASYAESVTVPFQTAWPDSLYLQLPATTTDSLGGRVTFTTRLVRPLGVASAGLQLSFSAADTLGNPKGTFYNITPSDTTGTVSAQFWLLDSNYQGFVTVTASLATTPGDTVKGQTRMLITKAK